MDNCHDLVVSSQVTLADGYREWDAGCSASPEHNKQTRALDGPQRATKQDATTLDRIAKEGFLKK